MGKVFDKIQNSFIIKTLCKLKIEEKCFIMINYVSQKPIAIKTSHGALGPSQSGRQTPFLSPSTGHEPRSSDCCSQKRKGNGK